MTLFCGAYLPDQALNESPFVGALTKIALNLTRQHNSQGRDDSANIDLYFLLPTDAEKPDFRGMRFHSYDAKHNTLRIESSVPEHLLESRHSQAYVLAAIKDAIENASDFFSSQNIGFDRSYYDQLIDGMMGVGIAA
jgi:hypothetical protein